MIRLAAPLMGLLLVLGACAHQPYEPVYPGPLELSSAQPGIVLAAQALDSPYSDTLIDDGTGARLGGYTGLIIGSFIGQGSGRALGALIGLGVGALTGAVIENESERKSTTEYLIRLETGDEIVVVVLGAQEFAAGDTVRVIDRGHGFSTVLPAIG